MVAPELGGGGNDEQAVVVAIWKWGIEVSVFRKADGGRLKK